MSRAAYGLNNWRGWLSGTVILRWLGGWSKGASATVRTWLSHQRCCRKNDEIFNFFCLSGSEALNGGQHGVSLIAIDVALNPKRALLKGNLGEKDGWE